MDSVCKGFSKGRIEFIPNNQQGPKRNYSERSTIELREHDMSDIRLRALDIENNKKGIFDIRLKNKNQYKRGGSDDNPDEIRDNNGTYRLWLHEASREKFYEELHKCFQQLEIMSPSDEVFHRSDENDDFDSSNRENDVSDDDIPIRVAKPDPSIVSPKDLLPDVHHLSEYIEQGDSQAAARIASQLASQGVRLLATFSSKNIRNEKEFTISVQLDGNEYGIDQHGAKIPVDVFQSTTVRELRAVFELAYQYPPTSQYFFVNGCLAHDSLTMKDLKVGPNSLFVLFLLTHTKSFQKTGPWRCPNCQTNNQTNDLRCKSCKAARSE